ncbi:glycyl-tRNA synthetase alpha subunit [Candidatus Carsonella ruddii CS isolate Thao2000]|uniref:Glycine--tRNA ligase alpha subunit n=1 Tax=Candidatus Carsonella ruddii CS isolate Thao2000 TaxID=1202537 RepID=J7GSX4_CARRU|nr:glycine--tRNA ligase subunit alpha [Candidatus Carsonella ruddii]AFP83852.1 glycyl-tRNA synthetase alpha subunit [Candidatus Carsonella ruddii CS isolate Thao2000]
MKKILNKIFNYWKYKNFYLLNNINEKIGAATYHNKNIISIFKKNTKIIFSQNCYREFDSYCNFKNKLCIHNQIQIICKKIPFNFIKLYKNSLNFLNKKFFFKKDNWSSPILGAKGVGYEVIYNNIEISQITIFYLFGNKKLSKPILEITYGVERISNFFYKNNFIYEKFFSLKNIFEKKYLKKILFIFKNCIYYYRIKNYYISYINLLKISNFFNKIDDFYLSNNYNRIKIIIILKKIFEKIIKYVK